jgi:long-chain acyl-CoA synthetase
MAVITHGSKIIYPAEIFDAKATLQTIIDEQCTAIHGVPAMFDSILGLPEAKDLRAENLRLRTGIIAGAPVPRYLMEMLVSKLGMTEFTSSYGLTEASPTCFNAFTDDPIDTRLTTVGTVMPHARAKIVDRDGNIVPIGTKGELCMSGYQLQAGYWNNSEKTNECMVRDDSGVLWLHTGDEAVFDERGYCSITGRFKDIIIRGTSWWIRDLGPRTNRKQEARTYIHWRSRSVWQLIPPSAWQWLSASRTLTTGRLSAHF